MAEPRYFQELVAEILDGIRLGNMGIDAARKMLMEVYTRAGYSERDASQSVAGDLRRIGREATLPSGSPTTTPVAVSGEPIQGMRQAFQDFLPEGPISGLHEIVPPLPREAEMDITPGLTPSQDQGMIREQMSRAAGGRRNIFDAFLSGQPGYNVMNPFLQRAMGESFDPMSAQFTLQSALDPTQLNFRKFLKAAPQQWGRQEWEDQLAPLGAAFSAMASDPTKGEGPSLEQANLYKLYQDQALQNRMMQTFANLDISPFIQRFTPGSINLKRQQQLERDPGIDVFSQFLNTPGAFGVPSR
jgi:hypothetical protein